MVVYGAFQPPVPPSGLPRTPGSVIDVSLIIYYPYLCHKNSPFGMWFIMQINCYRSAHSNHLNVSLCCRCLGLPFLYSQDQFISISLFFFIFSCFVVWVIRRCILRPYVWRCGRCCQDGLFPLQIVLPLPLYPPIMFLSDV